MPRWLPILVAVLAGLLAGCTSTKTSNTARTAKEQLLISNSVDRALDKVDFRPFAGRKVFLDEKYLECVDKNYVVASVRHRLLQAGAQLAAKSENAELVVEPRSGGVGTDTSETFVGIPEIAVPGPLPVALPEIQLVSKTTQRGTAKIGLVAYEVGTGRKLGQGGMTLAQSDDNNWFLMGVGPFQNGTVRKEVSQMSTAGRPISSVPNRVAFDDVRRAGGRVRLSGDERDTRRE